MPATTTSLWLVPDRHCAERFAKIIDALSEEWGTSRFAPHVTLLGGVEAAEADVLGRSERLAAGLDPVALGLLEIAWTDAFFRAFYVTVEKRPALLAAHVAAAAAFGRPPRGDYFPHLSLAYGKLDDERRRAARERIANDFGTCRAVRLDVVKTDGPPECWETLAAHPLRRSD